MKFHVYLEYIMFNKKAAFQKSEQILHPKSWMLSTGEKLSALLTIRKMKMNGHRQIAVGPSP